jgi:hypothetical protein
MLMLPSAPLQAAERGAARQARTTREIERTEGSLAKARASHAGAGAGISKVDAEETARVFHTPGAG